MPDGLEGVFGLLSRGELTFAVTESPYPSQVRAVVRQR